MLTDPEQQQQEQQQQQQNENEYPSLRDYVREGWKDLELELRIAKEELRRRRGSTQHVLQNAYIGTRSVWKDSFRAVKEEVREQLQEIKADFWKQDFGLRSSSNSRSSSNNNTTSHPTDGEYEETIKQRNQRMMVEIRDFEATLRDPLFLKELNTLIQSKLTSGPDLVAYYQERPELKEFTLTKELHRMTYTVFTHQGQKLTNPQDILNYARESSSSSSISHPDHPHDYYNDILWSAANQSIFGDVISSLTCETGLVRPQFSTGSFVDDVSVTLDFGRDTPLLTAECFVNVTIPGSHGERLSLAGALIGVYFCPMASVMEARVLHISPNSSPGLTDEELQGAAENLAR